MNGNGTGNGDNGNGNGMVVRKWQVWVAIAALLLTMLVTLFQAGEYNARVAARLDNDEAEIKRIEAEYERKDVVEEQLKNIQEAVRRIETSEGVTNDSLQKLLEKVR